MIVSNALKTMLYAVPFAMIVLFGDTPGKLEGRIFPVVGKFQVVDETVPEAGSIKLSVSMKKMRDCRRLFPPQIYIKDRDNYWNYTPVIRDPGDDGRIINSPPDKYNVTWTLLAPSWLIGKPIKIVTHHQCWGFVPWDVETISMIGMERNVR